MQVIDGRKMPLVLAVISAIPSMVIIGFMLFQGGFGGGHGPWDQMIYRIALPWSAILEKTGISTSNLGVDLIFLPWILNFSLAGGLWTVGAAVLRMRRRQ